MCESSSFCVIDTSYGQLFIRIPGGDKICRRQDALFFQYGRPETKIANLTISVQNELIKPLYTLRLKRRMTLTSEGK